MHKIFSQEDYNENDKLGKKYALEVAAHRGWNCVDSDEHKSKFDLLLSKNGKQILVEAEVRDDPRNNFDNIGSKWNTIHVPERKGKTASEKKQLADFFLTFRKDGKFFWEVKMAYAIKFPVVQILCKRNNEDWEDDIHNVKIDRKNVKKFQVIRGSGGNIVGVRKIL